MGFFDSIKEGFDDFVFNLTTEDRYASSRTSYNTNNINSNSNAYHRPAEFENSAASPSEGSDVTYKPGMRSQAQGGSEIAMRDYGSSIPVSELWERLEKVLLDVFPDLVDFLNEPATAADLNELENDIGVNLPLDVRDSFQVHDGQERGGKPSGVIMGLTILDLESVAEEYMVWQTAAQKIEHERRLYIERVNQYKSQMAQLSASSPSEGGKKINHKKIQAPVPRIDFMAHQRSFPEGAIQPVYVHSGWVPLVKDFSGNNIAVDLAPGPKGKWGQIICFGQDFDTKFVVADSWSNFLESVVKDFEKNNLWIDEEYDELWYSEKGIVMNYFDVLKKRNLPKINPNQRRGYMPPRPQKQQIPASFPATNIGAKQDSKVKPSDVNLSKETLIVPENVEATPKTETERVAEKAALKFSESESVLSNEEDDKEEDATESKPLKQPSSGFI